jgi:energy-coupling factor transport system substrate-specific component
VQSFYTHFLKQGGKTMSNQPTTCHQSRIAGCDFAIYPMTDQFVDVISSALQEIDSSKVWMKTTDVGTCVRGRISHVFDVTKALFFARGKYESSCRI